MECSMLYTSGKLAVQGTAYKGFQYHICGGHFPAQAARHPKEMKVSTQTERGPHEAIKNTKTMGHPGYDSESPRAKAFPVQLAGTKHQHIEK